MMTLPGKPVVMCVDDEPQVLEGLALHLRRRYQLVPANNGYEALDLLAKMPAPAVIVSDMRMPGMDGASFLSKARALCPDSVRMLLTGHAEVEAAAAAVNEGGIFRFLAKPCPPAALLEAVDAALGQHQLLKAERVLLEETLHGAVKALTEVLSITSPAAFGRASRVKQLVSTLMAGLQVGEPWQVEVAAMLCQLGAVTLPPDTAEKVYFGRPLNDHEKAMVNKSPEFVEHVLSNIPRLENVRSLLALSRDVNAIPPELSIKPYLLLGVQVLRAAMDLEQLESQGMTRQEAHGVMTDRANRYGASVMAQVTRLCGAASSRASALEIPKSSLRAGMVILEDVYLNSGQLLVARGFEVTAGTVQRIQNFPPGVIREPIKVRPPPASSP
jgi:response regulator RpfG family c-di-GMP phosphodiesterase